MLTWNLFHGRDFPPDLRGGSGWRLLGRPVYGDQHVLVNRDLSLEFAAFLAAAKWEVALLQEVPPRWEGLLADATGAVSVRTLTSRNWIRPFTFPASRFRPQLAGSWEGGSNLILIRTAAAKTGPGGQPDGPSDSELEITERHTVTLARWPERRRATLVKLACNLSLVNFHASTGPRAEPDILRAAEWAVGLAGEGPLVLGGDFNARARSSDVFDRLEREYSLTGVTAPGAIDHILVRGLSATPPEAWDPERRDVPDSLSRLSVRLSDHGPVRRCLI